MEDALRDQQPQENLQSQSPIDQHNYHFGKWIKVVLIILGGLVLMGGIFYAGVRFSSFRYGNKNSDRPPIGSEGAEKATTTKPTLVSEKKRRAVVGLSLNKVFYAKDGNIFSYDTENGEVFKWTNYTSPSSENEKQTPSISIHGIRVIDENTIGFGKCAIVPGDFGCGIYTLDLRTKDVSKKLELDGDMFLVDLDFISATKFSYLASGKNKWVLLLVDNGDVKTLEEFNEAPYGRGGNMEDSEKIRFSPNGDYLLQISTSSPRSLADFNIYVYNLKNNEKTVIFGGTQPEWLDDSRIIYRGYQNGGLHIYDITKYSSKKILEIPNSAYQPEVLNGTTKIIYTLYPQYQIWLYDLSSKENRKISDNALWGYWINPSRIVYEEVKVCDERSACDSPFGYKVESISVWNLEENNKAGSILPNLDNYNIIATFYN